MVQIGDSMGPEGTSIIGTVGAFGIARGGKIVVLTAWHVARSGGKFFSPSPALGSGQLIGQLHSLNRMHVDAAAIWYEPEDAPVNVRPGGGRCSGARQLRPERDDGIPVFLHGATSKSQSGNIVRGAADGERWRLLSPVLALIPTAEGDSGAGLFDSDDRVVGLLAGRAMWYGLSVAVFSPIQLVLAQLNCTLLTKEA